MPSRKRKRQSSQPRSTAAVCPFSVHYPDENTSARSYRNNKREFAFDVDDMQALTPHGRFVTHETLQREYEIRPANQWYNLPSYRELRIGNVTFYPKTFVAIANEETVQQQDQLVGGQHEQAEKLDIPIWVAYIAEIRGKDADRIWARIFWMYSPDEVPPNALDEYGPCGGRRMYHGKKELIASNHMDVINCVSIREAVQVNRWDGSIDTPMTDGFYWRQGLNVRNWELSSLDRICVCNNPVSAEWYPLSCRNEDCDVQLHRACIRSHALIRTFNLLGSEMEYALDKPFDYCGASPVQFTVDGAEDKSYRELLTQLARSGRYPTLSKPLTGKSRDWFKAKLVNGPEPCLRISDRRKGLSSTAKRQWFCQMRCLLCNSRIQPTTRIKREPAPVGLDSEYETDQESRRGAEYGSGQDAQHESGHDAERHSEHGSEVEAADHENYARREFRNANGPAPKREDEPYSAREDEPDSGREDKTDFGRDTDGREFGSNNEPGSKPEDVIGFRRERETDSERESEIDLDRRLESQLEGEFKQQFESLSKRRLEHQPEYESDRYSARDSEYQSVRQSERKSEHESDSYSIPASERGSNGESDDEYDGKPEPKTESQYESREGLEDDAEYASDIESRDSDYHPE